MAGHSPEAVVLPGLSEIEAWAAGPVEATPASHEDVLELAATVARLLAEGHRDRLRELADRLTPVAATLSRHVAGAGLPTWATRAVRVATLAATARGVVHELEQASPELVLGEIPHGATVLRALARRVEEAGRGREASVPVRLAELVEAVREAGGDISRSRVSRTLSRLEREGFVHVFGATRGRRVTLLPLAWRWFDAAEVPRPSTPETGGTGAGPTRRVKLLASAVFRAEVFGEAA